MKTVHTIRHQTADMSYINKNVGHQVLQKAGPCWPNKAGAICASLNFYSHICIMLIASGRPGACAAGRTVSGLAILAALVCLRSLALLLRAFGGPAGS